MTDREDSLEQGSTDPQPDAGPGGMGTTTIALMVLMVIVAGAGYWLRPGAENPDGEPPRDEVTKSGSGTESDHPGAGVSSEATVATLVESEDWILRQTTQLPRLARGAMNLQLPDVQCAGMFADSIKVVGLQPDTEPHTKYSIAHLDVESRAWDVEHEARSGAPSEMGLWKPLFKRLAWFERAKFYFVRAKFTNDERTEIEADMNFDGVARTAEGQLVHVKGKQVVVWKKRDEATERDAWQISYWKQKALTTTHRDDTLFRDVVDQVIPEDLRKQVRESVHEQRLLELASSEKPEKPHPFFSPHASDRHPSVSVVDIDRDGFDDLYVMARWGRNLLFRNRGDGTFEEIAAKIGLDIEDHCSSAIFADFDNDGDSDLFLGRTLERSMYLANEDGQFVDRTESNVSIDMPYLVFSISSADYNGDGLMDVLFCTYAQETQYMSTPNPRTRRWLDEFLPVEQAEHLYRLRMNHFLLERPGPPNVLLVNRGNGKFDLAPESKQVAAWRQSTQGTWSDIDDDGDLDLYMSNDFSINTMYRNDGPSGFVDITSSTRTADIGFGMGVSWGDYDLDGQQDLYVSNMFSKAGQRITSQLEDGDPRFADMARGNSLFRKEKDRYAKVSGLHEPALQVEMAGWSWGGQFVDIDNDGYLDIHALSGFYTAPKQFALPGDL